VAATAEMVESTLARFGSVDILVNVAGIDAPPGAAWEIDADHWREVIDVDLTGQWWCARAVLPHMMERGSGRIIFISSGSARVGDHDISVAYNAAKAGLIGLTIGLSVQLESSGILVNAVAPGSTGTGRPIDPETLATFADELPLGVGGPEPVAHACLYLARPSGDWVSGTVMNVSGGWVSG
jgi:NAD(P)-dependent dehydrogenase (short-subunit alcohol dehydrogenase family)